MNRTLANLRALKLCGASAAALSTALVLAGTAHAQAAQAQPAGDTVVQANADAAGGQPASAQPPLGSGDNPAPAPPVSTPSSPAGSTNADSGIVVTGFRSSLARAIQDKRNSAAQIDTIKAEDIGKFPDLNLSESVQRIPGVTLARDAGEGREISVRGLGPQFTRVRINGLEALTTTGTSDAGGGANRGRGFDFNVFASDLFNQITVRKTAEAAVEEGSLGATVDLQTAHPFDYKGFTFVASGQEGYNDLAKKANPRGAVLLSNSWFDGKLGALVSVAYSKRELEDVGTSTVRWAKGSAFSPGFDALPNAAGIPTTVNPAAAANNDALHPRFPRYDNFQQRLERIGATGSIQFRPDPKTLFTFDALYADFKGERGEQYLEAPSFSVGGACTAANRNSTCGIADTNVLSSTIQNGVMVKGTFNDVDLRVENRFDELETTFTQYSLDMQHEFTDNLKGHVLLGHSKSELKNPLQTTVILDQYNVQGYAYDYTQGRAPLLSYGNARLTDPSAWILTQIRERPQFATNTYDTGQAELKWQINQTFSVQGGVNLKAYRFDTVELRRSNGTSTNQEPNIPAALLQVPVANYSQLVTLNTTGLGVPTGTPTTWLVPDLNKAASVLSLYDQTAFNGAFRLGREPALGNNRGVSEKDTGAFLQTDFDTRIADMAFRGNVGVRYVRTLQSSNGYTFVSGAPVPIYFSRGYEDVLPSMNLVLEPYRNVIVRFGAAKVMSRPDLGSLTPGATISVSGANRTVTAGNPNLEPFRSNDYDLSFEWYPYRGALAGLALFRKDVSSFVQTVTTTQQFAGNPFGLPESVAVAACGATFGCSPTADWAFSAPRNSPGGPLTGFEINVQTPFTFLPYPILRHTGILANYTFVKSDIKYLNSAGQVITTNDLTGLSRHAYNLTAYYEDSRLSTRVSLAYRSHYLTRVPGAEVGTDVDGTNSTLNLDFSAQYTINPHLKLTFEGVNLTDEFQDQFNDSRNLVSFYHHTGREFLAGVRFTF